METLDLPPILARCTCGNYCLQAGGDDSRLYCCPKCGSYFYVPSKIPTWADTMRELLAKFRVRIQQIVEETNHE